ncbi:MAG: hypothetical protein WAV51_04585 [Microgenomates group bacterium]
MQIQTSIGSVVGTNSSVHWAQTIKTPNAYGIVEVTDDAGIAQTVGMQAIGKITRALERAPVGLHEVELIANEGVHDGIQSIVLVVPVGSVFYIVVRGSGTVFLKRNGQYAKLLDHEGSISGQGSIGDIVILISGAFGHVIEESKLIALVEQTSAIESAEKLAMVLNEESDSSGCAAILLEVDAIIASEQMSTVSQTPIKQTSRLGVLVDRIQLNTGAGKIHRFIHANSKDKLSTMHRHVVLWRHRLKNPKVSITMILLICFGISVLFGVQKELTTKQDKQITSVMTEANRMFEEGTALMELNPVKGRERLVSAKTTLQPAKDAVTNKTKEGRRVLELYSQIDDALIAAMHAYSGEPQMFYDAGLLKSDGAVSGIAIENDTVLLGDAKQKAIYSLSLPGKNGSIIGGGTGYETVQLVAVHGATGYALLSEGVNAIAINQKQTKQNVIKKSEDWGVISSMVSFGGNIYLLDSGKSRIWKYVATETGFSEIREYLNPDTLPDLSKSTSMVIDGSVWIGTNDGKIMRFTQGKENSFYPKGVDPAFGLQLVIYTSDEVNNIYVLDNNNKRVVVLDKDGMYMSQYIWESEIPFTHLAVSEKHGKILLLGNDTVYSLDIK